MRLHEIKSQQEKLRQIKQFAEWAIDHLKIETPPEIKYGHSLEKVKKHRTFGSTSSGGKIWVHIGNRNTADVMRTLAHELVHSLQFQKGTAKVGMDDEEELQVEDEANAIAGRMLRAYGKIHEKIYESKASGKKCNDELKALLLKHKKTDYDSIDKMMTQVAKKHKITPKKLHDLWVAEYGVKPDPWIKKQLKKLDESKSGEAQHAAADSLPQAFMMPQLNSGNPYEQYKFGVAIASARGRQNRGYDDIEIPKETNLDKIFGNNEVIVSFDPNIGEIIDQALKAAGLPSGKKRIGVEGSKESPKTDKQSPVQGFKGFNKK